MRASLQICRLPACDVNRRRGAPGVADSRARSLTTYGVLPVTEATANIPWSVLCVTAAVVARDWEPLRDPVLRVISRVGGKTVPGLRLVNQCLRNGLLELALMTPDGTWKEFSRTDCGTVCAPLIHPAEGVRVEPYEDGDYFIRRASHAEPTSLASEPAASAVEPLPPSEPKHPAPASSSSQVKTEPALSPSEPAATREPPAEDVEWQKLPQLPEKPQLEESRKWRPNEVRTWFKSVRKTYPQKSGENKSAYARRLHDHMKNDFEGDPPWGEPTLRRRLND
jgi:hypothetical protein